MSQSTTVSQSPYAVLIQRDGELAEFAHLLESLAVPVKICDGPLPQIDDMTDACLVIAPGQRLIESPTPNLSLWPKTIAVVDGASKTLVAHLCRLGTAAVVRRPIHPRTLRLLLLHTIYRGPERRHRRRISVGVPVRIGAGLFKSRATLLELSSTGARIELANPPKVGNTIKLILGKDLTQAKPIKLEAKVVRCIRPSSADGKQEGVVGVSLVGATKHAKVIEAILDRYAVGPASWDGTVRGKGADPGETARLVEPVTSAAVAPGDPSDGAREHDGASTARALPPPRATHNAEIPSQGIDEGTLDIPDRESVTSPWVCEAEGLGVSSHANDLGVGVGVEAADMTSVKADDRDESDRRGQPRIPYDRRIVALGDEAARVLVGRDLSVGGMRIETTEAVAVGDVLRVALHCGSQTEPLVVLAEALRDDGDEGVVLTFQSLSPDQSDHLEKIIAGSGPLPELRTGSTVAGGESENIVIGEMLETVERGDSKSPNTEEPLTSVEATAESDESTLAASGDDSSVQTTEGADEGLTIEIQLGEPEASDAIDEDEAIDRHLDSIFDTGETV